jgi:hypothetical protein
MPDIPFCHVVEPPPVEERDGRLYVAGVEIIACADERALDAASAARRSYRLSGVPLDVETVWRIEEAMTAKARAAGSNMPVGIRYSVRLHRCRGCGTPFIAHHAARLCSDACRGLGRKASERRASGKRTVRRVERRASLKVQCRHCGGPVEGAARSTRAFCSDACRQAAYRARASSSAASA